MRIFRSENRRRLLVFGLLGAVLLIALTLSLMALFAPKEVPTNAHLASVRSESVRGQAGGVGSDEYNKKLGEHDHKQANKALLAGESYVPTPVGRPSSVARKEEPKRQVAPPVVQPRTAPANRPRQTGTDPMLKRMMEDLAALDARLSGIGMGTGKIEFTVSLPQEAPSQLAEVQVTDAKHPVTSPSLKAGDLLYAVVETGVNSDVPSVVMASVTTGKLKNARLLGKFQRFEERLVLSFSRAILPDGSALQLEAYAVDPTTSEASVASSVDTHFFSRWGGLIAATFLEGLGTAKRFSGATSTVYSGGLGQVDNQMVWNTYKPEDQAWIAAGKVGEKASEIFTRNFDRPPTVTLESGAPIGVLVLHCKAD